MKNSKFKIQNYNSKLKIIFVTVITILIFTFLFFIIGRDNDSQEGKLDSFAQCLTEKKGVMYGAYWCKHCQNQKKVFGNSFRYINYVECTKETSLCLTKKIEGYPTWIFEGGTRMEGEQSLQKLSEVSGCTLP